MNTKYARMQRGEILVFDANEGTTTSGASRQMPESQRTAGNLGEKITPKKASVEAVTQEQTSKSSGIHTPVGIEIRSYGNQVKEAHQER